MIPPFDDFGNLPPGMHLCTIDELVARFGSGSEERETETNELLHFIEMAQKTGVRRLMVNGSYATGKLAPNDVDLVCLPGRSHLAWNKTLRNNELVWPFLQILIAADDGDFEAWATIQFGTDRKNRVKGVLEVML